MNAPCKAVVDEVCKAFHVEPVALLGRSRMARHTWPRMVAWYLLRTQFAMLLEEIGAEFERDHSTVHHGITTVERRMRASLIDRRLVEELAEPLRATLLVAQARNSAEASEVHLRILLERLDAAIEEATAKRRQIAEALLLLTDPLITRIAG